MKIASLLLATACMFAPVAYSAQVAPVDPLSIQESASVSLPLIERALSEPDEALRYHSLESLIKTSGPWITYNVGGKVIRIHITSYLLQKNKTKEAVALLKNNVVEGWLSYRVQDGVANDFIMALDLNNVEYVKALVKYAPTGVDGTFAINLQGNVVSPLGMLAATKYMNSPQYESLLYVLLNAGANPHKKLPSGTSPIVIASSSNNMNFVRITQAHLAQENSDASGLLSNSPLDSQQLLEMQAIADTLIERTTSETDKYSFTKLHDLWVQMIIKGYNMPAELIYDILVKRDNFNIDYKKNGGITALTATSLSQIYGGNVEYAKKLIERGADPTATMTSLSEGEEPLEVNLIQLALEMDNYKVIALLISKGANYYTVPGSDDEFILEQALQSKSFKSAYIIEQALRNAIAKRSGE